MIAPPPKRNGAFAYSDFMATDEKKISVTGGNSPAGRTVLRRSHVYWRYSDAGLAVLATVCISVLGSRRMRRRLHPLRASSSRPGLSKSGADADGVSTPNRWGYCVPNHYGPPPSLLGWPLRGLQSLLETLAQALLEFLVRRVLIPSARQAALAIAEGPARLGCRASGGNQTRSGGGGYYAVAGTGSGKPRGSIDTAPRITAAERPAPGTARRSPSARRRRRSAAARRPAP